MQAAPKVPRNTLTTSFFARWTAAKRQASTDITTLTSWHFIETNLRNYSFAQKDYLDNVRAILDSDDGEEPTSSDGFTEGTPREPRKIIQFSKKESSERLNYQVF